MLLLALLLFQLRALLGSLQKEPSYWLQVQELVTVQEGLCVLVPCSFHSAAARYLSTRSYGYWYKKKENSKIDPSTDELVATNDPDKEVKMKNKLHFFLLGDPQADNCSLSISGVQKADSGRYYFRLEKGNVKFSYRSSLLTLIVTGLTQTPDIHIQEPLQSGHLSHVTCSMPGACDWPMAPNISWAGAALRALGSGLDPSTTSEILLTPHPQDHGTHLTCQVTFPWAGVSSESTVQLSVSYAPQNLTISIPTAGGPAPQSQGNVSYLEVQKGQSLQLLCAADSHPPATLSWVLEDRVLSWSCSSGPRTLGLELPMVKPGDSGRYTCRAENRLGSQHGSLDLSVQYPPEDLRVTVSQENRTVLEVIQNGTSLPVLEGQSLRLVCVAPSNPPARLSWTWGLQTLSPELPADPGVLELPRVQAEHEGEFTCHARSQLGSQYISLSLSVHYPPRLLGPSCSWEAEALHCSCSSRAWPAPSLHWWLGEGLLEGNSSNASLSVTSSSTGPWANSSLSLHEGLSSGLMLSCEAQNARGTQSATVLLLPGKPELRGGALLGILGAAGGAALLSLCTYLILMKTCKKKAGRMTVNMGDAPTDLGLVCGDLQDGHCNVCSSLPTANWARSGRVPAQLPMQYAGLPQGALFCRAQGAGLRDWPGILHDHSLGSGEASWSDRPSHDPTCWEPALTLGKEPELQEPHYASLSFLALQPHQPEEQEATNRTEYAEVKICK